MSICITPRPSVFHKMIASITKAEIIYSKEHEGGTLYALIHTRPQKKHSTLDRNISALDDILMTTHKTSTTFFKSISPHYNGKVRTFENNEHIDDPIFHVIFNVHQSGAAIGRKYNTQPGVCRFPEQQTDIAEASNDQTEETNTSSHGTPGKRRRVDPLFVDTTTDTEKTSELRSILDANTRELELLKNNYSTLERSSLTIRSTAQAAIDELTTAGAEKDAAIERLTTSNAEKDGAGAEKDSAIAALTASNAKKDASIERLTTSNTEKDGMIRALESLTNAFVSRMDQLQATTDDIKLQSAQHTNDLETKIDQVRTAVISRAEGTGRQITTALDSHGETMVAEMERMMQEKGACEQHVMDKYQRASAKANRYAQTKKGIFTRKFNKAKKAYVAEIQKLKTDLVVETRLRQCVINNFFELIPTSSDQHRPKESPPAPPTPPSTPAPARPDASAAARTP